MSQSQCPVCGKLNNPNQQSCYECGFPIISLDNAFSGITKKSVLDWAKKIYSQLSSSSKQTSVFIDNKLSDFADSAEPEEDEQQKLQSENQQLRQERSYLQQNIKNVIQNYKQFLFNLEILKKEILQTQLDITKIDPRQINQLNDKWNQSFQRIESTFHSLSIQNRINQLEQFERKGLQTPPGDFTDSTAKIKNDQRKPESVTSNNEQFQSLLEELKQIVSQLKAQSHHTTSERSPIASELQNLSQIEQRFSEKVTKLNNEMFIQIINYINHIFPVNIQTSNITTLEKTEIFRDENSKNEENQTIVTQEQEVSSTPQQYYWVSSYNQNPDSFAEYATEVSETTESINQRRLGTGQPVVEKVRKGRGNYWVITDDKNEKYLVPKGGVKINQYNLATVKTLFECQGYSEDYNKFTLIQPAIVSPIESDKWQLVELGVLQF